MSPPAKKSPRTARWFLLGGVCLLLAYLGVDAYVRHRYSAELERISRACLLEGIRTGDYSKVQAGLAYCKYDINQGFQDGDDTETTFLHLAVTSSDPVIVKLLLEGGLDPRRHDGSGVRAIERAVDAGRPELVPILLGGSNASSPAAHASPWCEALRTARTHADVALAERIRTRAPAETISCDETEDKRP